MRDIAERASLTREDRQFVLDSVELRDDGDDVLTFDGVASTVDTPYVVRDMFGEFEETMVSGAFTKTLKEKDDVRLLVNHDGIPLARTTSKTLSLSTTPHLRAQAPLDARSPLVQTVRSAMDRKDMDQMSIGFRVTRQEWNEDYTQRWIREVQLFDVSLVTFPANPTTSASLRSLDEAMRAFKAEDVDEDEVRRAIAHLESLLPPAEVEEIVRAEAPDLTKFWEKHPRFTPAEIAS
jgi:HK97 family phage prohead protease